MTPEQEQKLEEIYTWMLSRKEQQISMPLDEASKNVLGAPTLQGFGSSALTDEISLSGGPEDIDVPTAYAGTLLLEIEGGIYEIPYL